MARTPRSGRGLSVERIAAIRPIAIADGGTLDTFCRGAVCARKTPRLQVVDASSVCAEGTARDAGDQLADHPSRGLIEYLLNRESGIEGQDCLELAVRVFEPRAVGGTTIELVVGERLAAVEDATQAIERRLLVRACTAGRRRSAVASR